LRPALAANGARRWRIDWYSVGITDTIERGTWWRRDAHATLARPPRRSGPDRSSLRPRSERRALELAARCRFVLSRPHHQPAQRASGMGTVVFPLREA